MHDSLPAKPEAKPKPWGLWATLGFSVLVFVAFILIQTLVLTAFLSYQMAQNPSADLMLLIRDLSTNGFVLSISTIASAPLCVALIVLFIKLRKRLSVKSYLGIRPPSRRELITWCLITIFVITIVDLLKSLVDRPLVPNYVSEIYESALFLPALYLALIVMAPVFEEVFFRGFMFQGIKHSALGNLGAIGLPAIVWAIIHLQYAWYDIAGIFVFGVVLGYAQLKTKCIYVPIAMHALNNLLAVLQVSLKF
ncbi:CPBP family intramembrane metalloprotease [Oculatella sp. LEGE 06141]|uniref:CPBP family intramembrane glutamic endopeptidase n=1 Tax=Oculatella sp. LEGE 06141 TaxID=1828648 RepID=UPI0018803807|nr:type II CAAX endopeptidase family protein [Oculatella sp. LEGE 06141]MBE9178090.1 CPBP family intramembrane metalloprotease [Oculatella sp. LEGE 06141]